MYIKHYREGNAYFSQWIISSEDSEKGTLKVKSTSSLDISNKIRDKELKKLAKSQYGIDVEEHLIKAAGFINNHVKEIFPKEYSLIKRSKKESQLIKLANKLDKKYNIVIDSLTGHLHIYDPEKGIYVHYTLTEFSAFLKKEYDETFLLDEVTKIMGTFNTIKEESTSYIAFKNCLLNIDTLKTEEFNSNEFVKFQVPYNWNPKAKSKTFKSRIKEILVDEERYKLFLQILGYCFTPNNHHHKMFFITGEGGNGKSTLMGIISKIFHNSVGAVGLHEFKNNFGLQPLLDKKINVLYDLPTKTIKDTGIIKAVTGEDLITINRKHKEAVSTILGCKIIGTGNQLPVVDDDTYAFWRRVIHIELTNTFKDPTVREKILNDNEGIEMLIYEAITAYKNLEVDGWAAQKTIAETRKEYFKKSDPCKYAAEQLFEKTTDPYDEVSRDEVVSLITKFLEAEGIEIPKSHKPFYKAIREMGGSDKEKTSDYERTRVFTFIKTKEVTKEREKTELEALALKGDEEAQAELDFQTFQEITEKSNES
ncbi:MAG: phage/plasmid primase, P4 family [Methanobacterium sp. ERen5]|nr:MAG: phage/plasmid primase, P4 family [Methanobacterium sp. ERen5]